MTLNERVKAIYKKSKLTYQELANLTGIKVNTLSCWINNKRTPPDYVVALIEERVNNYLQKEREFIDKTQYRDSFAEDVYKICENNEEIALPCKIMKAFDKIPTVFKK